MPSTLLRSCFFVAVLISAGCQAPWDAAPRFNRGDAAVWMTEHIEEDQDTLRVRVRTARVEDADRIAERIVEQRKAQMWRVIEVEVSGPRANGGEPPRTVRWEYGRGAEHAQGR